MARYNILSLDGGGLRGVISATILKELASRLKLKGAKQAHPFHSYFDLIAGTSTGALIALCLSSQRGAKAPAREPEEVQELFMREGASLFKARLGHRLYEICEGFAPLGLLIQAFSGPAYDGANIERRLKEILGENSICDCLTEVLISSYDMHSGKPWFFSRKLSPSDKKSGYVQTDLDYPIWQVARASSAAPSYFPPYYLSEKKDGKVSEAHALIDGGLAANHPAMAAIAEALDRGVKLDDISLLSIGTGWVEESEAAPRLNFEWFFDGKKRPILDAYAWGNERSTDFEVEQLRAGNFKVLRLEGPRLSLKDSAMDDAGLLEHWKRATELYCEDSKTKGKIRQAASLLA